jgi:hypothetical protein
VVVRHVGVMPEVTLRAGLPMLRGRTGESEMDNHLLNG